MLRRVSPSTNDAVRSGINNNRAPARADEEKVARVLLSVNAHTHAYALPEAGPSGERAPEMKCASKMLVKPFDRLFMRLFSPESASRRATQLHR